MQGIRTAAGPSSGADAAAAVRPFLKWAGGKRQLLPHLRRFVPRDFQVYCEPFVGSGAFFFDLWQQGRLESRTSRLIDTNADLIGCYRALARDVDAVIRRLQQLARQHGDAPSECYYRVRDDLFNPARRARSEGAGAEYPADLAAMFIYLNRTGFNGLFRLNSQGTFNVPAGRYARPRICDDRNLRAVGKALGSPRVQLVHDTYERVLDVASTADLIYLDPPYAPVSATSHFTAYTPGGFGDNDQRQLRDVVVELAARGCHVILSNSTAPIIEELYGRNSLAQRAGLRAYRIPARRAINSNAQRRGAITEFIVSNVAPE